MTCVGMNIASRLLAASFASALLSAPAFAADITLPQSDTTTYSGSAFQITNTANFPGGSAATPTAIAGTATGTGSAGVRGQANGDGGQGVYGKTLGTSSYAVYGNNFGTGYGGRFALSSTATHSSSSALYASNGGGSTTTPGTFGQAGRFEITNKENTDNALAVSTIGSGNGGFFSITAADGADGTPAEGQTPTATSPNTAALRAENRNTGSGELGQAGYFAITNTANYSDALYATTPATYGAAVHGYVGPIPIVGTNEFFYGPIGLFGQDLTGRTDAVAVGGISQNGKAGSFNGGSAGSGYCYADGSSGWNCSSDRSLKDHFQAADNRDVLDRLDHMPVYYYQMKGSQKPTRYLGPTAQDFKAAFDIGENDTTINTANAQGVALAAAKGLYEKLQADEMTIAAQQAEISALKQQIADIASLKAAVAQLQAKQRPLQQASAVQR